MKRLFFTACLFVMCLAAYAMVSESRNNAETMEAKVPATAPENPVTQQRTKDLHSSGDSLPGSQGNHEKALTKKKIDCKMCHDCEYPTGQKPCLVKCPRTESSVYHSPAEAPEVLALDELSDRFGSVVFSHRQHAQMSEMGTGCTGCHHYNTTGPVLNCKKCHEQTRKRENITVPDLEAAYHRQCMPCHRQWGRTTDCDSCHLPKGAAGRKKQREATRSLKGRSHPERPKPTKIVYETSYDRGKFVTFYHDEHTTTFKQPCINCHKGDNCIKCHDVNKTTSQEERHIKVHKTFEEHHKACSACHEDENCSKCHKIKEKERFNHAVDTGWDLKKYHAHLPCQKCHEIRNGFNKPDRNCRSCHKGWKRGAFNHKVTGLELSANHIELECENCHQAGDFTKKPVCKECHTDKEFPKELPGKRVLKR
jgi:hypothetical protein